MAFDLAYLSVIDTIAEQEADGISVAEIFKLHGEGFFRDKETEVLRQLSLMRCVVVSTGGGAVVRNINWKYMQKGITVWLDVPLDALTQRISAVGTGSRPLLPNESGDIYSKKIVIVNEFDHYRVGEEGKDFYLGTVG
ncbi:hypothetical protein CsatB_004310 [Cannabis sativa]